VPQSEAAVRSLTANVYAAYVERMIRTLAGRESKTGPKFLGTDDVLLRARLADMVGIDRIDAIIQRAKDGGEILTRDEALLAANRGVAELQPSGFFGTPALWQ
ncbi:MAG: hypothetical protein GTO03_17005, partial [Planctomycetales bacterium]|nr:hypothetical protein [Planctomycetales bacterium]